MAETKRTLLSLFFLLAFCFAAAPASQAQLSQEQRRFDRYILRVQEAVRERVRNERGGRNETVTFNNDAARFPMSGNQVGVRGTGVYQRGGGGRDRREEFTYEGVYNTRAERVERAEYRFVDSDGGGGGGNEGRDVPRWLVGSFRGRNPSAARPQRMLVTVENNGRVSVVYGDGRREQGTYTDRQLRIGSSSVWNISRNDNNGFRAQDDRSRRSEDFIRVESGAGDNDDDNNGRVPRWVVGTFRGMTSSGESELTINRDGTATATSLVNRTSAPGRYDNGVLTFAWGSFNVTREGDGIRTVQVNDRRNQTTYRRIN
jgi:hypothetical protein